MLGSPAYLQAPPPPLNAGPCHRLDVPSYLGRTGLVSGMPVRLVSCRAASEVTLLKRIPSGRTSCKTPNSVVFRPFCDETAITFSSLLEWSGVEGRGILTLLSDRFLSPLRRSIGKVRTHPSTSPLLAPHTFGIGAVIISNLLDRECSLTGWSA